MAFGFLLDDGGAVFGVGPDLGAYAVLDVAGDVERRVEPNHRLLDRLDRVSQIDGLRAAIFILALIALIALPFTRPIPTVQPGAEARAAAAG